MYGDGLGFEPGPGEPGLQATREATRHLSRIVPEGIEVPSQSVASGGEYHRVAPRGTVVQRGKVVSLSAALRPLEPTPATKPFVNPTIVKSERLKRAVQSLPYAKPIEIGGEVVQGFDRRKLATIKPTQPKPTLPKPTQPKPTKPSFMPINVQPIVDYVPKPKLPNELPEHLKPVTPEEAQYALKNSTPRILPDKPVAPSPDLLRPMPPAKPVVQGDAEPFHARLPVSTIMPGVVPGSQGIAPPSAPFDAAVESFAEDEAETPTAKAGFGGGVALLLAAGLAFALLGRK